MPTEQMLLVSYRPVKVGGVVATVQAPVPEVVNVLEPFLENPQNTIMQFATGGVIPADVHVALELLACPLLVPIGVPVSCPLKVDIVPLLVAFPPANVKSVATISVEVAIFQNVAVRPVEEVGMVRIDVQVASGAVIAVVLEKPT
jgi:hypothetical protein